MVKLNVWRGVAILLLGFILGCLAGAWFQAHYLDKPDTVTTIEKQTVKGHDINATVTTDVSNGNDQATAEQPKKTRRIFKHKKN